MIVITGGAGFIGSCLLKYLNNQGYKDIIVVDNFGNSSKWKNTLGKDYSDYIHKSVFPDFLDSNKEKIECIFHLGACSSTTETDVDYLYDNNYLYSRMLAEYCIENEVRFIYASSAATYGLGENGFFDNEFTELYPLNPYGYSKYLFDKWVVENNLDKKFVGLKFFNVFGPNEYHKDNMASMIYKSYNQILETGSINLFKSNTSDFKDGEQKRDFIYVKDVVEVMLLAFKDQRINGIFNLGTGKARSWNDLANSVFNSLNINSNINYIEMPERLKGQYQNYTEADMSKFEDNFGEFKFTELEEAVEDYIKNYLSQENKYL